MFPHHIRRVWERITFNRNRDSTHRVDSEQEMIDKIANTPDSIGYLNSVPDNENIHSFAHDYRPVMRLSTRSAKEPCRLNLGCWLSQLLILCTSAALYCQQAYANPDFLPDNLQFHGFMTQGFFIPPITTSTGKVTMASALA